MMTVQELINELQKLPATAKVTSFEYNVDDYVDVVNVQYNPKEFDPVVRLETQQDLDV